MTDIQKKLAAPFPPEKVSWRIGQKTKDGSKAMALAYIDARDVMERLDEVCGVNGWQCEYPHADGKTVCAIGIRFDTEWIWKANGAGDTDIESEKGALSAAFKRAAVCWGIGRYLYDVDSPWVATEGEGKFSRIAKHEYARLQRTLPGARIEGDKEPAATRSPSDGSRGAGGGASPTAPAPANRTPGGETLTGRETGAVKQGPAPVSPITHEQAAIISAAETFMFNATDEDELDQWARDNGAECKRLGIVAGSAAGKRLREIIEKRRVEIREADMPAGQLEAAE